MKLLNKIVTDFDALAAKHNVEKIKTIGDAYMVASGVPDPTPGHTASMIALAEDMLKVMERIRNETGLEVSIRIGIATGPVMAGVIGRKKFSYDIWGNAVNLASRLEGLSKPCRILVCSTTYRRCKETYVFESGGRLEIKGAGQQDVYFLEQQGDSQRSDAAQ